MHAVGVELGPFAASGAWSTLTMGNAAMIETMGDVVEGETETVCQVAL